jgi:hypothetical protein
LRWRNRRDRFIAFNGDIARVDAPLSQRTAQVVGRGDPNRLRTRRHRWNVIMKLSHCPVAATLAAFAISFAFAIGPAAAQDRHDGRRPPPAPARPAPHLWLDQRFQHDHYYPRHGEVIPALPGGSISIGFGSGHFYFHGGVWFRALGGRFVVIAPPIGVIVPLLPPAYATLWIGGLPYYYANGVYYAPAPGQGYAVVTPPPGIESAQPTPPPVVAKPPPEPVIYPRNGQSAQQTDADRQECNRWATTQQNAMNDADIFNRAVAACMDARGYTLR